MGGGITANTFKSVYKAIESNKDDFRKPFKRNNIPYPSAWPEDEEKKKEK